MAKIKRKSKRSGKRPGSASSKQTKATTSFGGVRRIAASLAVLLFSGNAGSPVSVKTTAQEDLDFIHAC